MSRGLVAAAAAGLGAAFAFRLGILWTADAATLASLTPDDAYYYFQVAQNVARGNGFSFDGLRLTNGYHPLWAIVCAAVAQLFGNATEPEALTRYVRVMLTIQLLFGAAAATLLSVTIGRALGSLRAAAIVLAGFATPWVVYAWTDGLESGLSLLAMAALFHAATREKPFTVAPRREDLAFGALLSLAFLARLDYAFLCFAVGAIAIARGLRQPAGARLRPVLLKGLAWGAPVVLIAAVYLGFNRMRFDTVAPISGTIKSTFPDLLVQAKWLLRHPIPFAAGAAAMAITAALWRRRSVWPDGWAMLACGSLFIAIHSVYTLLFVHWAVHAWHFTAFWPVVLVAAAWGAEELSRFRPRLGAPLGSAAVVTLLAVGVAGQWRFFAGRRDVAFQARSVEAALWARERLPRHELIGMSDCGVFGYYRGNLTVNLDGVVNDRAYQEALVGKGLAEYLRDRDIGYIAHHAVDAAKVSRGYKDYEYRAYSRLYRKPGGAIVLRERNELFRSKTWNDGTGPKVFVIWRLDAQPRRAIR